MLVIGVYIVSIPYRGQPLSSSSNLDDITLLQMLYNFFANWPLVFFDHRSTPGTSGFLYSIGMFAGAAVVAWSAFRGIKALLVGVNPRRMKVAVGLLIAYFIMIVPTLPFLMPWYAIYSGLPLFLMISLMVAQSGKNKPKKQKTYFFFGVTVLIISMALLDRDRAERSENARKEIEEMVLRSKALIEEKKTENILIVGYPSRVFKINTMTAGRQQMLQHYIIGRVASIPDILTVGGVELKKADEFTADIEYYDDEGVIYLTTSHPLGIENQDHLGYRFSIDPETLGQQASSYTITLPDTTKTGTPAPLYIFTGEQFEKVWPY
ncbi:MAG: hypothetical protein Kapaf2KO_06380 [Candidatus Kapaibacteriales bacterium]